MSTSDLTKMNLNIWFGNVVDRVDPLKAGRLQVRIINLHGDGVTDDILPWAIVNQDITTAGSQGIGKSPTGVIKGTQVWGVFLDNDRQIPLIVGVIPGLTNGISDVNILALGTNNLDKGTQPFEPPSQYSAQYPYNHTQTTESGHVIEIDDTPGAERIHIYHRKGSYLEMNPDGSLVKRTNGNDYDITLQDKTVYIGGSLNVSVEGDANIQVIGNTTVQSEGNIDAMSENTITLKAPTIILEEVTTDIDLSIARDQSYIRENGAISIFDDEIPEGGSIDSTLLEEFPGANVNNTPTTTGLQSAESRSSTRVSCLDLQISGVSIPRESALYNTKLSPHFTLGSMSINTILSRSIIQSQNGLGPSEIICNLKAVAENILEPIKARYPGFNINSGFRHGIGRSQHNKGQAVDLQWPGMSNRQMFEIAQWAARTLPIDQLIVEHGSKIWIHISYNRTATKQRGKLTTMINNQYKDGLALHY